MTIQRDKKYIDLCCASFPTCEQAQIYASGLFGISRDMTSIRYMQSGQKPLLVAHDGSPPEMRMRSCELRLERLPDGSWVWMPVNDPQMIAALSEFNLSKTDTVWGGILLYYQTITIPPYAETGHRSHSLHYLQREVMEKVVMDMTLGPFYKIAHFFREGVQHGEVSPTWNETVVTYVIAVQKEAF